MLITQHLRKYLPEFICFIAGILLTLAFAPSNIAIFAIIMPAILFYHWHKTSAKGAFIQGLCFGIGFYSTGISWIFISIHTFGNANLFLAFAITAFFILILALLTATLGYLLRKYCNYQPTYFLCLAAPIGWLAIELIRSFLCTGFPWLLIGNSQINMPLAGFAPLFSVYGVSFLAALSSGLLVNFFIKNGGARYLTFSVIALIWIMGALLNDIQWTKRSDKALTVSLIQGDIPVAMKWAPQSVSDIANTYAHLSMRNWRDIIVWPENALPIFPEQAQPFLDTLSELAALHQSAILLGLPIYQGHSYYNGAMVVGDGHGQYKKHHLVPFGEYTPLNHYFGRVLEFLQIPMSNFSSGPFIQPTLAMKNNQVAVFTCYEIAYPLQVKANAKNADFIITISDDSWFGHSLGAPQQEEIAQMRALETGRYVLSASNDGMTSIIDPKGHIIAKAPRYIQTVLTGKIYPMHGNTPWLSF